MMSADAFYESHEPPRQGDILLCGVTRVVAADGYSPPQWESLDTNFTHIEDNGQAGRPLNIAAGIALAMVVTHDCQLDKEWNRRVRQLMKEGANQDEAEKEASADSALDRTLVVSPLLDPEDLQADRGNLLAGRVIGYLPVPRHPEGLIEECVVDLTYQCTIDRYDVVKVASVSEAARKQLRYALIQLDALRTANLGFEVEAVVGHKITEVNVPKSDPLTVHIQLDDGQTIQLLQQPGTPDQTGRPGGLFRRNLWTTSELTSGEIWVDAHIDWLVRREAAAGFKMRMMSHDSSLTGAMISGDCACILRQPTVRQDAGLSGFGARDQRISAPPFAMVTNKSRNGLRCKRLRCLLATHGCR